MEHNKKPLLVLGWLARFFGSGIFAALDKATDGIEKNGLKALVKFVSVIGQEVFDLLTDSETNNAMQLESWFLANKKRLTAELLQVFDKME